MRIPWISIIGLALILHSGCAVIELHDKGDFYQMIHTQPRVAVLFVDSSACAGCLDIARESLRAAALLPTVTRYNITELLVDLKSFPDLKEHYRITRDYSLVLFVRNQLVRLEDVQIGPDPQTNAHLIEQTLYLQLRQIAPKVNTVVQIQNNLVKHKVLFVLADADES